MPRVDHSDDSTVRLTGMLCLHCIWDHLCLLVQNKIWILNYGMIPGFHVAEGGRGVLRRRAQLGDL